MLPARQFRKGVLAMSSIEIVPSTRPTIITLEVPDEEVLLAFDTSGELLRERVLLALLESLVFDAPDLEGAHA